MDVPIFLSAFVTLFVIMDPPGAIPIFLALTRRLPPRAQRAAARRASLVALVVIASFAVFGQRILDYLHISVAALQGAGGLLLLIVALQLLTGEESEQHADAGVNVALVPLGTPLLAGPGAIVATMLAMQRAQGGAQVASVFLALAAVLLITWLTFRYAGALLRLLRESGIVLLSRIAGLLLSAIAVQMIADSVRAFIEA
ncbi:MAG TPA: MarC family protein [Phycicoccus sp.]|nr:MarC family protein [Phycicoccus sp.]HQH07147.1 MarC family protein [Phycicoccus sp.]HQK30143.1 MarC family protein [Phycicoccus sp.]HQV90391.1 MarC family protein [Phycicoccus sp.]HQY95575.1 MarC family protein [Phycicoccus sp.]